MADTFSYGKASYPNEWWEPFRTIAASRQQGLTGFINKTIDAFVMGRDVKAHCDSVGITVRSEFYRGIFKAAYPDLPETNVRYATGIQLAMTDAPYASTHGPHTIKIAVDHDTYMWMRSKHKSAGDLQETFEHWAARQLRKLYEQHLTQPTEPAEPTVL